MPDEFERYYFWEDDPFFGRRCLGTISGYETLDECTADNAFHIEENNKREVPCWVTKAMTVKVLVAYRKRSFGT